MRVLEKVLNKLDGYLLSIKRNPDIGMYEIEIGIPHNWVYKDTQKIKCEIYHETNKGKLIRIKPIVDGTVIDDLIDFIDIIINTNQELNRMQEEFDNHMAETKKELESQVQGFLDKLDVVKKSSFESIDKQMKKVNKTKEIENDDNSEEKEEKNLKEEIETKLAR